MRERRLAFVDTETTGLDPLFHEVIEIGCILAEFRSDLFGAPILEKIGEREWKLIPEHIDRADPQALRINRFQERDWGAALSKATALEEFSTFARGSALVAQNVTFDWSFLLHEARRAKVDLERAFFGKYDLASFAIGRLFPRIELQSYSLARLAAHYGVENPDAHTALSDAETAFRICKRIFAD